MQIDRYLLRCCAQINPQRIIDTPAVNLCSRLVSILSICKKANSERLFRTDKDVGGSIQKRVCLQTRSPRMYTDVHSWARHLRRCCAKINAQRTKSTSPLYFCSRLVSVPSIFKKANGKRLFRTDKDVGGSNQQRCFCGAKTRVQKLTRRSIFERAMDGGGSQQKQVCSCKLVAQK